MLEYLFILGITFDYFFVLLFQIKKYWNDILGLIRNAKYTNYMKCIWESYIRKHKSCLGLPNNIYPICLLTTRRMLLKFVLS